MDEVNKLPPERSQDPPPAAAVTGVLLLCRDLHRSLTFYEQVLGFRRVIDASPRYVELSTGEQAWVLHQLLGSEATIEDPLEMFPPPDILGWGVFLQLTCVDLDRIATRCANFGVTIYDQGTDDGRLSYITIKDPDGYLLELSAAAEKAL